MSLLKVLGKSSQCFISIQSLFLKENGFYASMLSMKRFLQKVSLAKK